MPKLNALEELHIALDLVAREEPAMSVRETAERFLRDERAAIEPFADAWLIKEIARQIQWRRSLFRREKDPQQMILDFKPPKEIEWRPDETVAFGDASLWKLRQHRKIVSALHKDYRHPAVAKIDRVIEIMEPYAKTEHGITWDEVVKLEAAKRGKTLRAAAK